MNTLSLHHAECSPFYRVPKFLFLDAHFSSLPGDAKILYSLLLDRTSLSAQNGWLDAEHHVYIFFSVEEICSYIGCARKKTLHLLTNLETIGLIRRKFRGQGRPTMIYVCEPSPQDFKQTGHNDSAKCVKTTPSEVSFLRKRQTQRRKQQSHGGCRGSGKARFYLASNSAGAWAGINFSAQVSSAPRTNAGAHSRTHSK